LPSFELSVPDLHSSGPVIPLHIGPSRELITVFGVNGIAAPISVNALVDTGASSTVITPEIVAHLNLKSVGLLPIFGLTTLEPVECRQFHINMYFTEDFAVENVLAIEAPLTGQPFQCLIGRDILSRGVLTYIGIENKFKLTF
jgi:predicted aspartyl protease